MKKTQNSGPAQWSMCHSFLRAGLPELPDAKRQRFIGQFGLGAYDAGVLVADKETADYYEAVAGGRDAKLAANWVTGELFSLLGRSGTEIAASPVSAAALGTLLDLLADGTLSRRSAKQVLEIMFETGREAPAIVAEQGLQQVSDSGALAAEVDRVVAGNPDKVAEYRGGKDKLIGWFVGQVMQATKGKANPKLVNDLLKHKLGR